VIAYTIESRPGAIAQAASDSLMLSRAALS